MRSADRSSPDLPGDVVLRRRPRPAPPVPGEPVVEAAVPAASLPTPIRGLVALQASAGNAAVAAFLSRRAPSQALQRLVGTIPPPPVAPSPPIPDEHPGYRAARGRITGAKRSAAAHPSPASRADAAGKAAKPPADDKEAQAKTAKAGEMGAAPAGTFDKAAFVAAVSAAMAKHAPKNLDEADDLAGSGKASAVAEEVRGQVGQGKDASAKPMVDASAKTPDTGVAKDKPVTPLAPPAAAGTVPAVDGKGAMPARAPAEQTELGGAPAETGSAMADAEVTEDQLAKSNEPEFTGALDAKKEGEQHSATAPAAFRESEAARLATAGQGAQASGVAGAAGMLAARGGALGKVGGAQQKTQSTNEARRAEVSGRIKSIFDTTKTAVDAILAGIDPQVNTQFTEGEKQAKAAFTAHHKARMDKYKDDRYSGLLGAGRWIRDKFADLPGEVNQFYVEAKTIYETRMKGVISDVADTVGRELTRAKDRIVQGRKEISTYVDGLEPALKGMGKEAANEIGSQFESLESSVDEKSQSLAEDLAEKYVAARTAVDEEITALQEENKGLWSKAKDAIGGAIQTILKLKDMLLGVLARAAGAVSKIIKDPIGFLGNFVSAVKAGVMNFGANILEHLKKGLQAWLFGALAEAGIEIPEKFDLKGIVTLVLSLLGLTWTSIRARLAKVLPEWVLTALETAVEVVKILTTEGVGGLWKWIVEKIVDLKEQVMSQIKDLVITKIITAGITWLVSLLNPAAAFIKACKMIYDAVMWFVDNAARLKDFVDSVLESVESIASGGVGKVAALIESTLAKALPMVISGLASLLGLGGIAEKIQEILKSIQKPVGKVVDGIIAGVMKFGKKMLAKLKKKKKDDNTSSGMNSELPFDIQGHGHTAEIQANRAVLIKSSPRSPSAIVSEVANATRGNPAFEAVRSQMASAMAAVLQAETDVRSTPEQGRSAALERLTGALKALLSIQGQRIGRGGRVTGVENIKHEGRGKSLSASHYQVEVAGHPFSSVSASTSGETPLDAAGDSPTGQIPFPISLTTLRADDAKPMLDPGKLKEGSTEPQHWRGHDSELKLLEQIAQQVHPFIQKPSNDYAVSALVNPEVTGSVTVHSDFVICPSCLNAVMNFKHRFPNVRISVTSSNVPTPAGAKRARGLLN